MLGALHDGFTLFIFGQTKFDFTEEKEIDSDTNHGLGWEAGAGVIFPLSARLLLTPGAA